VAVAFDAKGTADVTADNATSINFSNITVGTGSNRALVVLLSLGLTTASNISVVWDSGGTNQVMTLIGSNADSGGDAISLLYGLIAPTSGQKTLHVSWTGSCTVYVDAVSFTGVNQAGGTSSFAHYNFATGSGTTASVTITSSSGNMVVATGSGTMGGTSVTFNGTEIFFDQVGAQQNAWGNYAAGASSVNMTASGNGSGDWVQIGVDVVAAGATPVHATGLGNTIGDLTLRGTATNGDHATGLNNFGALALTGAAKDPVHATGLGNFGNLVLAGTAKDLDRAFLGGIFPDLTVRGTGTTGLARSGGVVLVARSSIYRGSILVVSGSGVLANGLANTIGDLTLAATAKDIAHGTGLGAGIADLTLAGSVKVTSKATGLSGAVGDLTLSGAATRGANHLSGLNNTAPDLTIVASSKVAVGDIVLQHGVSNLTVSGQSKVVIHATCQAYYGNLTVSGQIGLFVANHAAGLGNVVGDLSLGHKVSTGASIPALTLTGTVHAAHGYATGLSAIPELSLYGTATHTIHVAGLAAVPGLAVAGSAKDVVRANVAETVPDLQLAGGVGTASGIGHATGLNNLIGDLSLSHLAGVGSSVPNLTLQAAAFAGHAASIQKKFPDLTVAATAVHAGGIRSGAGLGNAIGDVSLSGSATAIAKVVGTLEDSIPALALQGQTHFAGRAAGLNQVGDLALTGTATTRIAHAVLAALLSDLTMAARIGPPPAPPKPVGEIWLGNLVAPGQVGKVVAPNIVPFTGAPQLGPTQIQVPPRWDWSAGFVPIGAISLAPDGFARAIYDAWRLRVLIRTGVLPIDNEAIVAAISALVGAPANPQAAWGLLMEEQPIPGVGLEGVFDIDPKRLADLVASLQQCGGVLAGLLVTPSVWNDSEPLAEWDLPMRPEAPIGSQEVLVLRAAVNGGEPILASAFGKIVRISWDYWQTYAKQCSACIWSDWVSRDGLFGSGLATFLEILLAIGGNPDWSRGPSGVLSVHGDFIWSQSVPSAGAQV